MPIDLPPDFTVLSLRCAPTVNARAMHAIVSVESTFRQYAIAVVDGPQVRPAKTLQEAIATVERLDRQGYNYSVGYAQVNKHNFKAQGLTTQTAFEACANLRAGSRILEDCFTTAKPKYPSDQAALRAAFSCYYSGNFLRGFRPDRKGQLSYVDKVMTAALGHPDGAQYVRNDKLGPGWTGPYLANPTK